MIHFPTGVLFDTDTSRERFDSHNARPTKRPIVFLTGLWSARFVTRSETCSNPSATKQDGRGFCLPIWTNLKTLECKIPTLIEHDCSFNSSNLWLRYWSENTKNGNSSFQFFNISSRTRSHARLQNQNQNKEGLKFFLSLQAL